MIRIGIIGDIHGSFDEADVEQLDGAGYDLLMFVGDLEPLVALRGLRSGLEVAALMAELTTPALFVPGNHDTTTMAQLAAEVTGSPLLAGLTSLGHDRRADRLTQALGPVRLCAWELIPFELGGPGGRFDVITGRPYSMGGPRMSFTPLLRSRYGVPSLATSTHRLVERIDRTTAESLIFLAHNGPTGLGEHPDDLWGRDFGGQEGDWGDPDLGRAIDHARRQGKHVAAVIAGHMHHELRGGGQRHWRLERDGTLYINAAKVPRHEEREGRTFRHHLRLSWNGKKATIEEVALG